MEKEGKRIDIDNKVKDKLGNERTDFVSERPAFYSQRLVN